MRSSLARRHHLKSIIAVSNCSSSGFSLIEVMIGLGISGMVMLAVISTANISMKSGQLANRQTAFTELSREVRLLLDNPATCPNFLRDQANISENAPYPANQATVAVGSIFLGNTAVATVGTMIPGSTDLVVSSITIERDLTVPVDSYVNPSGNPYLRYYTQLNVTAKIRDPTAQPMGGKHTYTISLPFVAVVNQTSGRVENCVGTQNSATIFVPLSQLDPYYSPLSGFSDTCTPGNPNFIQDTTIACNRWCAGCQPDPGSLCTASLPSRGFSGGLANLECNSSLPNSAGCVCFR